MNAVRRRIAIVGASIVALAVCAGAAAEARACTCAGAGSLLAPVGAEHPRGASLVFESACVPSLAPWSVTVDGASATLGEGAVRGEIGTLEIMPTPAVGAEVVLFFDCRERGDDPGCAVDDELVERARFTIVAADTIAPPSPLTVTMERVNDDDSCTLVEGQGAVALDLEIGEREPGTWIAFELWRADGTVLAREGRSMPASGDLATVIHAAEEGLNAPEVCVDVTVRDASGNASDAFVEDCVFADGVAPNLFMRGCGCAAGPAPTKEAALLALFALMLRRRSSRGACARRRGPRTVESVTIRDRFASRTVGAPNSSRMVTDTPVGTKSSSIRRESSVLRNALTSLALLAACGREPEPAMQAAVLSRLDEIDARITALERRLEAERLEDPQAPTPDAAERSQTISVHVEAESIRFGDEGERLPDEMLSRRLEEAVRRDGEPTVLVRADPRISAARMTTILDLIELAGVRSVAIARVSAQSGDTDDAADTPPQ